jgi:hypothetical protein
MRIVVLAVSLLAMLASAASAATWQNTGDTSFTATAGAVTLSIGANNLTCGGSAATGNAPMSVAAIPAPARLATGTIVFDACRLAGVLAFVHCDYVLTGNTYVAPTVSGNWDITCNVVQFSTEICHVEGRTAVTYTSNAGDGRLSVPTSNTLIVTVGSGGDCSRLGTGNAHLTPLTFTTHRTGPMIALV